MGEDQKKNVAAHKAVIYSLFLNGCEWEICYKNITKFTKNINYKMLVY